MPWRERGREERRVRMNEREYESQRIGTSKHDKK